MIQNKYTTFVRCLLLAITVALNCVLLKVTIAQEVYVRTGFEEFAVGDPPKDWEVTGGGFEIAKDPVKTDKKALAILGGANGDGLGVPIETDNPSSQSNSGFMLKVGDAPLTSKLLLLITSAKTVVAPISTGTQIWFASSMEPHGNPLTTLKPTRGNTFVSSQILAKASLSSPQETTGAIL